MILILEKNSRDIVAVADCIREAKAIRSASEFETICEIVGTLSYNARIGRDV